LTEFKSGREEFYIQAKESEICAGLTLTRAQGSAAWSSRGFRVS
jgi:hypothetical protein